MERDEILDVADQLVSLAHDLSLRCQGTQPCAATTSVGAAAPIPAVKPPSVCRIVLGSGQIMESRQMKMTSCCLLAFVAFLASGRPTAAQGGADCLFQCDSQCYGQAEPYCRSGCMAQCNSGQGRGSATQSRPRQSYSAIAATAKDGDFWGYSFSWGSRAAAEQEALTRCEAQAGRKGACQIAVWFYNSCGALAIGSNGAWGADHADTTAQASASALRFCQQNDNSGACHVVRAFCSR
jgi:Domain of unknown function (DUF4189)